MGDKNDIPSGIGDILSFLIDPLLLFISGAAIFFAASKGALAEGKEFAIGSFIVLMFISTSVLLYLDVLIQMILKKTSISFLNS